MNIEEFIKIILIEEIKSIQQKHGFHYLSFILISSGIEFLGACLDGNPFHERDHSGDRFRDAIDKLFPACYKQYNDPKSKYDLYNNLRCGLLHVVLPNVNIELISNSDSTRIGINHLEIRRSHGHDRLFLVSESLFNDFESGCNEIVGRINSGQLNNSIINNFKFYT